MRTEIIYSDIFNRHDNMDHPENAQRTDVMIDAFRQSQLNNKIPIIDPQIIPEQDLYTVHNAEMITQVKAMSKLPEFWIDPDTYMSQNDFHTARLAAGAMVQLCNDVIKGKTQNGFALVRPPGHHATMNTSMGFCLFNNISIAAQQLVKQGKRVLIFDLDVHHGNGTQDIFYDTDKVLYQSFHLSPHFPWTGEIDEIGEQDGKGYTVNAPIPRKTGIQTVQQLFDEIFIPIGRKFKPDIILVSSGYDSHHADQLGGIHLDIDYFGTMLQLLKDIQQKMAVTIEGGYNLDVIGDCFVTQMSVLQGTPIHFEDTIPPSIKSPTVISDLKKQMDPYWDL